MQVRFAKPVIPGQTLKTDMWKVGSRIFFQTSVVETKQAVLTGEWVYKCDKRGAIKLSIQFQFLYGCQFGNA